MKHEAMNVRRIIRAQRLLAEQGHAGDALGALDELAALRKDAERYRWLRNEAWAGYNQGRGRPHVFTVDGAGNRRTMLAEEALDAAVDAAMEAAPAVGAA